MNTVPIDGRVAIAALLAASGDQLEVRDPLLAAEDLLSLWQGRQADRLAIGLMPRVTPNEIERRARHGTEVFLQAYRLRPATPIAMPSLRPSPPT